jgi:hypothetical protein
MFVAYIMMSLSYAYVMMVGVISLFKEKTEVLECLDESVVVE